MASWIVFPSSSGLAPETWLLAGPVICLLLYALYQWLLPRPIPGIPYNPGAPRSLLGDIPSLVREVSKTGDLTEWLRKQVEVLDAPVVQVFVRPLGRPFVLLADYRESQDVMARRREFDRSRIVLDLVGGLAPNHHFMLPTNSEWRAHRRLLQDLMTPAFLKQAAAPAVYAVILDAVELWTIKGQLATGRPFSADLDLYYTMFDALLAITFGTSFNRKAVRPQVDFLATKSIQDVAVRDENDTPVVFPAKDIHEDLDALLGCATILDTLRKSSAPKLYHWWIDRQTSFKQTLAMKNACIRGEIEKSVQRLQTHGRAHPGLVSAVDHIVSREQQAAEKDGRKPEFTNPVIADEIYGFILAGHETASTALLWALKFWTDYPTMQARLRSALRSAHSEAVAEKRQPTVEEIIRANVPLLDAVTEETLRYGGIPAIARDATCDTELLGYRIPKGTTVFMLPNGPGLQSRGFSVDEARRSKSCQAARPKTAMDDSDLDTFDPDRWLVEDVKQRGSAENKFDSTAGPQMAFGFGVRGCFGKKLAYLELRIATTLLIWNFEMLPVPKHLSGYEAVDCSIARKPKQCYIRLRQIL